MRRADFHIIRDRDARPRCAESENSFHRGFIRNVARAIDHNLKIKIIKRNAVRSYLIDRIALERPKIEHRRTRVRDITFPHVCVLFGMTALSFVFRFNFRSNKPPSPLFLAVSVTRRKRNLRNHVAHESSSLVIARRADVGQWKISQ